MADKVRSSGAKGIVIGLSGGLDSAVVTALSINAIGAENVRVIFLPESTTPDRDRDDCHEICDALGLPLREYSITPMVDHLSEAMDIAPDCQGVQGNIKARIRMTILYAESNTLNYLVGGTSNKSELLLGYFTKYGDGGSDIAPIGDLFKTQVTRIANDLSIPENIIAKPPTAGLCPGQTDERDLGMTYDILDQVLMAIQLGFTDKDIAQKLNIPESEPARIRTMVHGSRHKRKFVKIPKMGLQTVGIDRRE